MLSHAFLDYLVPPVGDTPTTSSLLPARSEERDVGELTADGDTDNQNLLLRAFAASGTMPTEASDGAEVKSLFGESSIVTDSPDVALRDWTRQRD